MHVCKKYKFQGTAVHGLKSNVLSLLKLKVSRKMLVLVHSECVIYRRFDFNLRSCFNEITYLTIAQCVHNCLYRIHWRQYTVALTFVDRALCDMQCRILINFSPAVVLSSYETWKFLKHAYLGSKRSSDL